MTAIYESGIMNLLINFLVTAEGEIYISVPFSVAE